MGSALAPDVAVALLLMIAGADPSASHVVRTEGSAQIAERAGLTVVQNPPLQLILSSGAGVWVSALPTEVSRLSGAGDGGFLVGGLPGFYPAMTASGEVVSVSMDGTTLASGGDAPPFTIIVAQFN